MTPRSFLYVRQMVSFLWQHFQSLLTYARGQSTQSRLSKTMYLALLILPFGFLLLFAIFLPKYALHVLAAKQAGVIS